MIRLLPVLALLLSVLTGCDDAGRASFEEAFFLYRDGLAAGLERRAIAEQLAEAGWSETELDRSLERLRENDPEGYRALFDRYRAHRGLPREEGTGD
jgi:hypothetical protein